MGELLNLAAATKAARAATGMNGIGTRASGGLVQVVNVTPKRGGSIVDPLSDWITIPEAMRVMQQIEQDGAFR